MGRNSTLLLKILKNTIATGDIAYKANREAVQDFDMEDDLEKGIRNGLEKLKTVQTGIDRFIPLLEGAKNAIGEANRRMSEFLRSQYH